MVRQQIEARGIQCDDVLRAMHTIPRHLFVSVAYQSEAYENRDLRHHLTAISWRVSQCDSGEETDIKAAPKEIPEPLLKQLAPRGCWSRQSALAPGSCWLSWTRAARVPYTSGRWAQSHSCLWCPDNPRYLLCSHKPDSARSKCDHSQQQPTVRPTPNIRLAILSFTVADR
jgi:hypothetical protein